MIAPRGDNASCRRWRSLRQAQPPKHVGPGLPQQPGPTHLSGRYLAVIVHMAVVLTAVVATVSSMAALALVAVVAHLVVGARVSAEAAVVPVVVGIAAGRPAVRNAGVALAVVPVAAL